MLVCIILPKIGAYRKKIYDETKYMSFLIKENILLEGSNKIWVIKSVNLLKQDLIVSLYTMNII